MVINTNAAVVLAIDALARCICRADKTAANMPKWRCG
jgi:hypothetical protein